VRKQSFQLGEPDAWISIYEKTIVFLAPLIVESPSSVSADDKNQNVFGSAIFTTLKQPVVDGVDDHLLRDKPRKGLY